jgi:hypothetical protein
MKTIWIFAAAAAGIGGLTVAATGSHTVAPSPEKPKVVIGGVTWENNLEVALTRAKKENKPVLHLQMFGNLDDEFC